MSVVHNHFESHIFAVCVYEILLKIDQYTFSGKSNSIDNVQ